VAYHTEKSCRFDLGANSEKIENRQNLWGQRLANLMTREASLLQQHHPEPETCQQSSDGCSRWTTASNENIGSCWQEGLVLDDHGERKLDSRFRGNDIRFVPEGSMFSSCPRRRASRIFLI
jgi:hypothetical protein